MAPGPFGYFSENGCLQKIKDIENGASGPQYSVLA